MIDFKSMNMHLIMVNKMQTYNHLGEPVMEVQVSPGAGLTDMERRVFELETNLGNIVSELNAEKKLIESNASVKDAYDKYRIVAALANVDNGNGN